MAGFSSRLLRWARWPALGPVLPLLVLPVYAMAGSEVLLIIAAGLPLLVLLLRRAMLTRPGVAVADQVIMALDTALRAGPSASRRTGCLVLQFDTLQAVCDRLGRARQSEILAASVARIRGALRPGDLLFALEDGGLVIALSPSERLDLESLVRIAGRLQLVAQQPMDLGTDAVQLTCCIGVCHAGQTGGTGRDLLDAAQVAVEEATHNAPGAIRAYTADLAQARLDRDALRAGFADAVADGQVRAYFQPQVSTDSGAVSGMEALVRWHHPERGLLTPGNFLPAIEGTSLVTLLGQTMLTQSFAALRGWDDAGYLVPSVSVNFSAAELSEPDLPERLAWQLDKFGLAACRLTVEVLESVVASVSGDIIARNIQRIADMGCGVDMDDFGTGNASITSIRRFALRRLKIDRSFVRAVDTDRDQQQLVTAILSMAERLGLEALAEGVETRGEHAMLAQLGCGHVQGFVVARPLPVEDVAPWLADQRDHLAEALRIGVRAR